jgi:IS5 family transposase
VLVSQTLYTQSDDKTEHQLRDRWSFMRFVGLAQHDPVPDAKTIWLYREQLARGDRAIERLFAILRRFCGRRLAGDGRSDCRPTVIEACWPQLTQAEKGHP